MDLAALANLTLWLATLGIAGWQYLRGNGLDRRLKDLQTRMEGASDLDALTGLPGRAVLETALEKAAIDSERSGRSFSLLYLDLDGLRLANDSYGHAGGDEVLRQAAARLATVANSGFVARLAGDEFAVIVDGDLGQARDTAAALQRALRRAIVLRLPGPNGVPPQAHVSASIGIASYPLHGARTQLVANASLAMQSVKGAGGNGYAEYMPSLGVDARDRMLLHSDLVQAIDRRQFELYYQPKVDAHSLRITGVEALLRWNHPRRGMVSPAVFIPLAEKTGLISTLGNWVIDEACRQAAAWNDQGLRMRVAVNISGIQLRQDDLVDRIVAALARHRLQPNRFTCEITESVAMENTQVTRATFDRLRRAGLRVSIDDFGTGHSSLAVLRQLPAEELKIDRAFVSDLATNEDARSIIRAIVQMAHTMDLRVVAEGVEHQDQRDRLIALGCDQMQGYLFGKPMAPDVLALWASEDAPPVAVPFSDSLFSATEPAPL